MCIRDRDKTDCEVLHVDLVERPVPMEELFSKISVSPLETNDSSFPVSYTHLNPVLKGLV